MIFSPWWRRVNGPAAGIINSSGRQHTRARAHAEGSLKGSQVAWTDSPLFRRPGSPEGVSWKSTRLASKEREREREQRLYYLRGPSLCDSCRHTCANVPTIATIHLWPRGHAEYRTPYRYRGMSSRKSTASSLRLTPRKTEANEGTNFFELSRDFDVNEPRSPFDVRIGVNRHVPSARLCAPGTGGNELRVGYRKREFLGRFYHFCWILWYMFRYTVRRTDSRKLFKRRAGE